MLQVRNISECMNKIIVLSEYRFSILDILVIFASCVFEVRKLVLNVCYAGTTLHNENRCTEFESNIPFLLRRELGEKIG